MAAANCFLQGLLKTAKLHAVYVKFSMSVSEEELSKDIFRLLQLLLRDLSYDKNRKTAIQAVVHSEP